MKRIIILIMMLTGGILSSFGQSDLPKFTVDPADIDALTENVTITFDVTGTAVAGLTDVYLWAWSSELGSPSEALIDYEGGSSSWGNISPNAKLTPVEGTTNKFQLKFPITVTRNGATVTFNNMADLFGVSATPGKLKEVGFLLRDVTGNKQTPGDKKTSIKLKALAFEESLFRTFPSGVSNKDIVTVYYNQNLATNPKEQVMSNIMVSVTLVDADGNTVVAMSEPVATTPDRDGEFAFTYLPSKLVDPFPEGKSVSDIKTMKVVFSGTLNKPDGTTETVTTSTFEQNFSDYQ
ncbi:MAG: hypothetical protein Q8862_01960 [Bacteroidota bacterium]|nr:hypothetical protein [Bacteroidota bacterium]MDP4204521.1 hypothetical protein [Bacteroidota bacterium]